MNQYQKNIFKGTIYSLLSGLIWGICGILGEFFFTHYPVSSGWITSMRLSLAGGFVLILSGFKFRSQLFDIWRKRKTTCLFWLMPSQESSPFSISSISVQNTLMQQRQLSSNLSVLFSFSYTTVLSTRKKLLKKQFSMF